MIFHKFYLMLMAILWSSVAFGATKTDDSYLAAKSSLQQILSDEFSGSDGAWAGVAIYSSRVRKFNEGCDCRYPRGLFDVLSSPILIVENLPAIREAHSTTSGDVSFQVQFNVAARTEGEGSASWMTSEGRIIVPNTGPKVGVESYVLRQQNGVWKIVDPELPHVGVDAEKKAIEKSIYEYRKVLSAVPNGADPRRRKNLENLIQWLSKQRSALEKVGTP